jgi:hypothetical protein
MIYYKNMSSLNDEIVLVNDYDVDDGKPLIEVCPSIIESINDLLRRTSNPHVLANMRADERNPDMKLIYDAAIAFVCRTILSKKMDRGDIPYARDAIDKLNAMFRRSVSKLMGHAK